MTATADDVARYTTDGTVIRKEDAALHDIYPTADGMPDDEIEMFFDDPDQAADVLAERLAILSMLPRGHEAVEVDESLGLGTRFDLAPAAPRFRVVDEVRGVDVNAAINSLAFSMQSDRYSVELAEVPTFNLSIPPVVKLAVRYIAPGGAGKKTGDDWANAAPLSAINTMIGQAAAIGGEVWLRADQGTYTQTGAITVSNGGADGEPVTIRGVDGNGRDMMAEIVGSRSSPWTPGSTTGSDVFRLNAGSNHLWFKFLRFRNQGSGCIRARQDLVDLTVTDCEAYNVCRFFECLGSGGSATITGLTIKRVVGHGFSKNFIRVQYASTNIVIEDVNADSERQDGDNFATGISFYGTANNAVLRRCVVRNCIDTLHGYQNCDGYSGERFNHHITLEDCEAYNMTDGGCDFKGDDILLVRCHFEGNHRNYRLWGLAKLIDCVGLFPTDNAGNNVYAQAGISAFYGAMVRVYGGRFDSTGSKSPTLRAESGGVLAISPSTVVVGGNGSPFTESGSNNTTRSIVTTLNPAVTTKPIIANNTTITLEENRVGVQTITTTDSRIVQLRVIDDAKATLNEAGYNLIINRQDYEDKSLPNPRVGVIQVIDTNGNLSDPVTYTVNIADVDDNPIAPADLVALGVTDFAWWDLRPGSVWQDAAGTMPALYDGDRVVRIDDMSGKGHHLYAFDDNSAASLRIYEGTRFLDPNSYERYQLAATTELKFEKVTATMMVRRDVNDPDYPVVFSHGLNNTTNYGISAVGGASARMSIMGTAYAASGTGAVGGRDVVLTLQSEPVELRSNANLVINPDVPDRPTLTYNAAALFRLFSDPAQSPSVRFMGRWYGGVITNRTEDLNIRFRIERQMALLANLQL